MFQMRTCSLSDFKFCVQSREQMAFHWKLCRPYIRKWLLKSTLTPRHKLTLTVVFALLFLFFFIWVLRRFGDSVQRERISRVQSVCKSHRHLLKTPDYRKHTPVFYTSEKYGVSYCKVGKISSTFWTQYFYILHHNLWSAKNILDVGREKIHVLENEENIRFGVTMTTRRNRMVILSARNPYTRLYSAYVDRIYLPSTSQSVRNDDKCKSLITFEEFLQEVVKNTRVGVFDLYWSPVFYLCKPCEMKPNVLFKQETFRQDFDYVVSKTGLESAKLEAVSDVINKSGNWTGLALVEDVLEYVVPKNIYGPLYCQTWEAIIKRLWKVLKIQGYIALEAPFPAELYEVKTDFENPNLFRKGLTIARELFPMTKAKRNNQRREALYSAFKNIDTKLIKEIQEVFRVDFEMFGYSDDPPPWDNNEGF